VIHRGDRGAAVRDIQHRLLALGIRIDGDELEGEFGPSTEAAVRAFQQRRGLPSDGLLGPDTWGQLIEAGYGIGDRTLYLRSPFFRGDDVRELQRLLNQLGFDAGREDGILGERTGQAIVEFQRNVGIRPDGIVGPEVVRALGRIRPAAPGPSRAVVREAEDVATMTASLQGSRIAIDPGHGPDDPGLVGPSGVSEAEVVLLLAADLADELAIMGAIPSVLRSAEETPSPSERARGANELDAAVCISVHVNGGEPTAEGCTCFYYGTEETFSPAGQRLAELVQDSVTQAMGLRDGRTHRLAVAVLRETRMPAVQLEPCFITNPGEEAIVTDPARRRELAAAVAAGIEAFFEMGGRRTSWAGPD
jgi:N-acetylmuramoyl-L-alanine amidase